MRNRVSAGPARGRWIGSGLLAATALGLYLWDAQLRAAPLPHAASPPDWAVTFDDFPHFWQRLDRTAAVRALDDLYQGPVGEAALAIRRQTGVRPTHRRWAFWLGRPMRIQQHAGTWCAVVRPGLAFRAAHWALATTGIVDRQDAGYVLGSLGYQWSDGAALIRPADLRAPWPTTVTTSDDMITENRSWAAIRWRLPDDTFASAHVRAAPDWPVSIQWPAAIDPTPPSPMATLARAVPDRIGHVQFRNAAGARALLQIGRSVPQPEALLTPLQPTFDFLWDASGLSAISADAFASQDECTVLLSELHMPMLLPTPRVGIEIRAAQPASDTHPLRSLAQRPTAFDYAWTGAEGTRAPVWGEALSWCLATRDDGYLAATHEPLLYALANASQPRIARGHDLAVAMDWARFTNAATTVLRRAAANGLIQGYNTVDVEQRWTPQLTNLASLGALRLRGIHDVDSDAVVLSGYLVRVTEPGA